MNKKITIISIILITIVVISFVPKAFQNDTFYLIKAGESLLKNGFDFIDHFSFHNLEYLYPHFLFSIIVYLSYNLLSFDGIYILTIIFSLLLAFVMYYVNIKNSNNKIVPLVTTLLFVIYMISFFTLRSQIISYTIFILEYYFLNKLINTNKNKYIIYIFLLSIILVNTHVAVYPFYFIIFLPIIGEHVINKILKKETYSIKKVLISLGLVSISGLISPFNIDSYTYLYKTLINDTTNYIAEHKPMVLINNYRFLISLIFTIILFVSKKVKLELKEQLLLLGLIFMTLTSIRHESLFYIFFFIIVNNKVSNIIPKDIIEVIAKKLTTIKGYLITLTIVIIMCVPVLIRFNKEVYIPEEDYPIHATKYIKENLDYENIRIFNNINIGSYLILNDIKVFVDSRTDLYTSSYNGREDIYNNYINVIMFNTYYEYIFNYYDIDYVLLSQKDNLTNYLPIPSITNYYTTEYQDENFILYKRNTN